MTRAEAPWAQTFFLAKGRLAGIAWFSGYNGRPGDFVSSGRPQPSAWPRAGQRPHRHPNRTVVAGVLLNDERSDTAPAFWPPRRWAPMTVDNSDADDCLRRIRGEFLEMPGLQLSVPQAARFWGMKPSSCRTCLDALVDSGFLVRNAGGVLYARRDVGGPGHR